MAVASLRAAENRMSERSIAVELSVTDPRWSDKLDNLNDVATCAIDAAYRHVDIAAPAIVSILLCDDDEIQQLNKSYRNMDRPTDTLSFPANAPVSLSPLPLGDIVVAYDTMVADAGAAGKKMAVHLTHLLIHGLLHLVGYDHENDADAQTMESLEVEILRSLGIDDPYALR